MRGTVLAGGWVALALLAGCGSSDFGDRLRAATTTSDGSATTAESTSLPATTATTTTLADTGDTSTTATTPSTTAEVPVTTGSVPGPQGVDVVDPDGHYRLTIGPDWVDASDRSVVGVEAWLVEPLDPVFVANVTVATQPFAGDLAAYLDVSIDNGSVFIDDFAVVSGDVATGAGGDQMVLHYTGTQAGSSLEFLAVAVAAQGRVSVATLVAPIERFGDLRPMVEPYLRTLAPNDT